MMKKKVFQKLLAVTLALSMLLWPTALAKEGTLTGKGSPSDHSTSAIKARGVLTIASESQSALDYISPMTRRSTGTWQAPGAAPCRRLPARSPKSWV